MLRPPPLINPELVSFRKLLLLLVFCAASIVMLFLAMRVVPLSLTTLLPLKLISLSAVMTTVFPPKLLPTALVVLLILRVTMELLLKKPLLVVLCASSKLVVFSPATMFTLPVAFTLNAFLACTLATRALMSLPALTATWPPPATWLPTSCVLP